MNANSQKALDKRNAMLKQARELGIVKPHTMKNDALEVAIAEALATAEAERQVRTAPDTFSEVDPSVEGDAEDTTSDQVKAREATREAWLEDAAAALIPLLKQVGAQNVSERTIKVSVGFPKGNVRKIIGQCHYAGHNAGVTHIFISPVLNDAIEVLGTLAHELIHADDQGESGHAKHFRTVAVALGLTGKMTATTVGDDLKPVLADIAAELGEYPHTKLTLMGGVKKQTTRMMKAQCGQGVSCPLTDEKMNVYTVRLTRKWIELGLPACPCGSDMVTDDAEQDAE